MDKNHLKQLLAGLCISSLVSSAALMTGCGKQAATGWSGSKSGTGSTQSGWSGSKTGAGSTEQTPTSQPGSGCSGWGGVKKQ